MCFTVTCFLIIFPFGDSCLTSAVLIDRLNEGAGMNKLLFNIIHVWLQRGSIGVTRTLIAVMGKSDLIVGSEIKYACLSVGLELHYYTFNTSWWQLIYGTNLRLYKI